MNICPIRTTDNSGPRQEKTFNEPLTIRDKNENKINKDNGKDKCK